MALIRCSKHDIPYNDGNPRGCPACAREADGGDADVMQELARVSKASTRPSTAPTRPTPVRRSDPERQQTLNELFAGTAATIQEDAAQIETTGTRIRGLFDTLGEGKLLKLGIPLIAVLGGFLWFSSGARFIARPNPAHVDAPLPLPLEPGARIEILFSILGTRNPVPHPTDRRLARYQYGTELVVDGLNGAIYDISYAVANRSWHGIRVGLPEETVRGAMALLGDPQEVGANPSPDPTKMGEYGVFASLDARPLRQLRSEVRPPNGCYDVVVDLRFQSQGILQDGDTRWVVVSTASTPPGWVSTRVTVTDRSASGPANAPAGC